MSDKDRQQNQEKIEILKTLLIGWSIDPYYQDSIILVSPEGIPLELQRGTYRIFDGGQEFRLPKSVRSIRDLGKFLQSKEFRVGIALGHLGRDFFYTIGLEMERWETDPILQEALTKYSSPFDVDELSLARDLLLKKSLSNEEEERLYRFFIKRSAVQLHIEECLNKWLSILLLHHRKI